MIHLWIKRLFKKKQYVQLECLGDRLVITDGDGKLIAEYLELLADKFICKCVEEINEKSCI